MNLKGGFNLKLLWDYTSMPGIFINLKMKISKKELDYELIDY